MKNSSKFHLAIGVFSVACFASSVSVEAAEAGKWSIGLDAGINLMQNVKLKDTGVTVVDVAETRIGKLQGGSPIGPGGSDAEFDPGLRFDVSVGYMMNQSWSVQLETGFCYNQLSKVDGSTPDMNVDFYQVPVLVDVVFTHPFDNGWSVYIGAGAGGVAGMVDISDTGSDTDFTFGYQAMAGIQYAVSERCGVGVGYKFLGTTEHEWTINGETGKTDPTYSHSILATFTFRY